MLLHLDADAFFAAVEQAADTRLRGKPIAVGGDKRGVTRGYLGVTVQDLTPSLIREFHGGDFKEGGKRCVQCRVELMAANYD